MNDDTFFLLGGLPYPCVTASKTGSNTTYFFTPWIHEVKHTEGELDMLALRGYWRAPNGSKVTSRQIGLWAAKRAMRTEVILFKPNTVQE